MSSDYSFGGKTNQEVIKEISAFRFEIIFAVRFGAFQGQEK